MTTPALFGRPPVPALAVSRHFADTVRDVKPAYARYAPVKRVACEECVWVLHEAGGRGEPPRSARTKRTAAVGTHEADGRGHAWIVLCSGHAELWRKREGK